MMSVPTKWWVNLGEAEYPPQSRASATGSSSWAVSPPKPKTKTKEAGYVRKRAIGAAKPARPDPFLRGSEEARGGSSCEAGSFEHSLQDSSNEAAPKRQASEDGPLRAVSSCEAGSYEHSLQDSSNKAAPKGQALENEPLRADSERSGGGGRKTQTPVGAVHPV